jgi:hypothetical protein
MKSASLPGGDLVIEALRRALYHEQVGRVFVLTFPGDITASGVRFLFPVYLCIVQYKCICANVRYRT